MDGNACSEQFEPRHHRGCAAFSEWPIGFPDLFGFRTIEITPEMVGKKVAVFAFIEVKKPGGRTSKAQEKMHTFLRNAGAVGGVARSAKEAIGLLQQV